MSDHGVSSQKGTGGTASGRRLRVVEESCVGCRICELACSMVHRDGGFNPRNGLIRVESNRETGPNKPVSHIDYPRICRQCDPAPCADACPAGAFGANRALAIQVIDPEECTGCGQCLDACPYGMVLMDREAEKAGKCDLCGGEPLCVRYCPAGALVFEE